MDDRKFKEAAADIRSAAGDLGESARKEAAHAIDAAQHKAVETFNDLEAQIRKNPTQSALIAGGIGLLIGLLIAR